MPHGLPLVSRFLNRPLSSAGNSVAIMTWLRRMSTKWSMCSMSTGHWLTQAPHVVHDHSASSSMIGSSSAGRAVPVEGVAVVGGVLAALARADERALDLLAHLGARPRRGPPRASRRGRGARRWRPCRYGACVNIVSRRFMIMSLGLSGLPVFHAGHCDWQRPHSVQAMKST